MLRCGARRARRAAATGPLVALLACAIVLALPAVALVSGGQLAPLVGAAAVNPMLASAFAASLVCPAVAIGLAAGAVAADERSLGAQLAPAVPTATRFLSATVVPLAVVLAPLTFAAVLGAAAASASAPAGRWLAAPIVVGFLATAAFGAAVGEAVVASFRRPSLATIFPALLALWLAVGWSAGEPLLGIGAPLARAVGREPVPTVAAAIGCGMVGAIAVATWALVNVCAGQPRRTPRQVRLTVRLPHRARGAVFVALVLGLARHRQIRRHIALAAAFAIAGTALLRIIGAPEAAASYFPFGAALVAAAVLPPAAVALRRGACVLRVCPVRPPVLARVGAVAGSIAAAATIAFVIAVAAPVALLEPAAWPLAETAAAVVIGAGVVGGSLVPWLPDRAVEQTASYVVVGGLAAIGSYALSVGAGPAAAVGIPEALFALVAANAAFVVSITVAGALER